MITDDESKKGKFIENNDEQLKNKYDISEILFFWRDLSQFIAFNEEQPKNKYEILFIFSKSNFEKSISNIYLQSLNKEDNKVKLF